ncbi:MAG: (Na+)-NQR maturation NqrM [Pseudomonadales bacterium]|nr:(Na+)-NQR maturation NqrM [Pseudomonadales bacterium]
MMEIIAAIIAFFVFFLFMATGLIIKGQPLKGSCGGVAKLMGYEECDICGGNPNKCDSYNEEKDLKALDLFYDATAKKS